MTDQKQNHPYVVPDGFFESSGTRIRKAARGIRIRRRIFGSGLVAASVALAVYVGIGMRPSVSYSYTAMAENDLNLLIEMTENDIFLNTVF